MVRDAFMTEMESLITKTEKVTSDVNSKYMLVEVAIKMGEKRHSLTRYIPKSEDAVINIKNTTKAKEELHTRLLNTLLDYYMQYKRSVEFLGLDTYEVILWSPKI
ncbi:hypothetical protein [Zooshikella sp. RANM57]|uniref:hypothetical protein n=1 Tax=Zooshikella sp. RANM57 TaxID=3425863 RepID=UPI003D6FC8E6